MLGVGLIGIQYQYQHWYRYEIDTNVIDALVSVPSQDAMGPCKRCSSQPRPLLRSIVVSSRDGGRTLAWWQSKDGAFF